MPDDAINAIFAVPAAVVVADTADTADLIGEILDRGNDVRDWPADEQDLHRNGHS